MRDTTLARKAAHIRRTTPNGGEPGLWVGPRRIGHRPCPPRGTFVVYTLFDQGGVPVYVGQSNHLSARIRAHRATKGFVRWVARECPSREVALAMEADLIRYLRPVLNRTA